MAALSNLYLLDALDGSGSGNGSLSETAPLVDTRTATGWTVGTHAAADSVLAYGSKQASTTFTGGLQTLPSTTVAPIPGGQCYRSQNTYNGTMLTGWWQLSVVFQALVAAGANVQVNAALWKGSDPSGKNATQFWGLGIGDLLLAHGVPTSNLQIGVSQQCFGLWSDSLTNNYTAPIAFANEYLFLQLACEISSAGSGATSDAMICTSPNSYVQFPPFVYNQSKLYFLKNNPVGQSYGQLSAAPVPASDAATGTGWTVGTVGVGNYSLMSFGSKRAAATLAATAQPSGIPNGSDCWATNDALTGTFAAGDWTAAFFMTAVAALNAQVKLWVRVWRSQYPDGSAATEITSGAVASSNTVSGVGSPGLNNNGPLGNLATHTQIPCITDINLPSITLLKEYLFLQVAVETLASGGGANVDAVFVQGPGSYFATTQFAPGSNDILTIGGAFPSC